jgi:hypothetical protein
LREAWNSFFSEDKNDICSLTACLLALLCACTQNGIYAVVTRLMQLLGSEYPPISTYPSCTEHGTHAMYPAVYGDTCRCICSDQGSETNHLRVTITCRPSICSGCPPALWSTAVCSRCRWGGPTTSGAHSSCLPQGGMGLSECPSTLPICCMQNHQHRYRKQASLTQMHLGSKLFVA